MQPLPRTDVVIPLLGSGEVADEAGIADLLARASRAARAVTLGMGFSADGEAVEPEISAVLVRGVVRSLLNPEVPLTACEEPFAGRPGGFADWSDADFVVLLRYRGSVARLKPGGADGS